MGLESLTGTDQVPRAVADALGVKVQGNTDPLEAVVGFVGMQFVLIVLDNFEHLIERAELASELLERCPNLTLLVTSRERLQLRVRAAARGPARSLAGLEPGGRRAERRGAAFRATRPACAARLRARWDEPAICL